VRPFRWAGRAGVYVEADRFVHDRAVPGEGQLDDRSSTHHDHEHEQAEAAVRWC
jgi:hypothetical protein